MEGVEVITERSRDIEYPDLPLAMRTSSSPPPQASLAALISNTGAQLPSSCIRALRLIPLWELHMPIPMDWDMEAPSKILDYLHLVGEQSH